MKYYVTYSLSGSDDTREYDDAESAADAAREFIIDVLVGENPDEAALNFNVEGAQ